MNTQPTPETAKMCQWSDTNGWIADIDFARQLERERDEWKAKYLQQNKDLGHELRDPNGTIWSECKRLQTELTSITAQRDRLAEALKEYREALSDGPENCSYKMYEAVDEFAEKALQSLTPNAKL
jgi:septal ring factor EnvC (AmiA/AmiB activator)